MMENKDQPIHPAMMQQVGNESYRLARTNDPKEWNVPCIGLTKREYFAAMAMKGFISNSDGWGDKDEGAMWVARASVRYADAILTELSKTESSSSQSNRG